MIFIDSKKLSTILRLDIRKVLVIDTLYLQIYISFQMCSLCVYINLTQNIPSLEPHTFRFSESLF